MNKFRQLGFIDYNGTMKVHSSLLSVVLHDQPQIKPRSTADQAVSRSAVMLNAMAITTVVNDKNRPGRR
jgi:hypothetical protein